MHRWILCGILFVMTICQGRKSEEPEHPLSVFEIPAQITPGMTGNDVAGLMGKPWRATYEKRTETGPSTLLPRVTYSADLYWHDGNMVANVLITNGYVTLVTLRPYQSWWVRNMNDYGQTMPEAVELLGSPNRCVKHVVAGKERTDWFYIDNAGSERLLLLTFNAKGQREGATIAPVYWDPGPAAQH